MSRLSLQIKKSTLTLILYDAVRDTDAERVQLICCDGQKVSRVKVLQKTGFKMCRSKWEMEKRKTKGSGWCLTFGLSSHLFFLLSFLWVLSSSFLTLSQPHMSTIVSSRRRLFAVQNVTAVPPLNMGIVGLSAVVK